MKNIRVNHSQRVEFEKVVELCLMAWGVKYDELMSSHRRFPAMIDCRKMICHILRHESYDPIDTVSMGQLLGGRDHTSVVYAAARGQEHYNYEPEWRKKCDEVINASGVRNQHRSDEIDFCILSLNHVQRIFAKHRQYPTEIYTLREILKEIQADLKPKEIVNLP